MNIKKTLKNNKYSCIAIGIFVVVIIVGFLLYKLLFPNTGTPIYGNRLDGINDVNYTKDSLNIIAEKIKEEKVVNAEINENGKIINVIVTVSEKPKKEDATKFAKIILDNSTKEQINYFDYQLFVKSEKEDYKDNSSLIKNMEIIEKLGLIERCNECGNKIDLRKPKNEQLTII